MGKLLEGFIKLSAEIQSGRQQRAQFTHHIKHAEAERKQQSHEFRQKLTLEWRDNAHAAKIERQHFISSLGKTVSQQKQKTAREMSRLSLQRGQQAAQDRAERINQYAGIRYKSAAARAEQTRQRIQTQQQDRIKRTQNMNRIRSELHSLRSTISVQLRQSTQQIRQQTAEVLQNARDFQQKNRENYYSSVQQRHQNSGQYLQKLRRDVSEMRTGLREELSLARSLMNDPAFLQQLLESQAVAEATHTKKVKPTAVKPEQKTTGKKQDITPPVAVEKTSSALPAENKPGVSTDYHEADDLTIIQGIGPGLAKHLVAAGINSYTKLASASEVAIKTAVGRKMPGMESWIQQARELVGLD